MYTRKMKLHRTKRSSKRSIRRIRRTKKRTNKLTKRGGQHLDDEIYARAQQRHVDEQQLMDTIKEQKNMEQAEINKKKGLYLEPYIRRREPAVYVDQESELDTASRQLEFNDQLDMAANDVEDGPITFGGKKRVHRKISRTRK